MYVHLPSHFASLADRLTNLNSRVQPIKEGTHLLIPWLQRPILMETRIKPRVRLSLFRNSRLLSESKISPNSVFLQNISTTTGSKDLQTVSLTLRVMFRPDQRHLATIYRSLGTTYDERVLPSIGNEVLKATVAQFDAAELITQREVVSARIREDLLKRAGEFNIVLEDVSLVRIFFSTTTFQRLSEADGVGSCLCRLI